MKKLFMIALFLIFSSNVYAGWELGRIKATGSRCSNNDVNVIVEPAPNNRGAVIKANFMNYFVETTGVQRRDSGSCNITIPIKSHMCGGCLRVVSAKWTGLADIKNRARGMATANYYVNAGAGHMAQKNFNSGFFGDFELLTSGFGQFMTGSRPILISADSMLYVNGKDSFVQMNTAASELAWRVVCCR